MSKYDGAIFSSKKIEEVDITSGGYILVLYEVNEYAGITCDLEDKGYIIHPYITYQTDKGQKMIVMVQKTHLKPMTENIKKFGIGALNIDECRVQVVVKDERSAGKRTGNFGEQKTISGGNNSPDYIPSNKGRFPSNLIHNGKIDKVFPEAKGQGHSPKSKITGYGRNYGGTAEYKGVGSKFKKGSTSNFFKTCKNEKALIKYLKKLICPKGKKIKVDV